MAPPGIEVENLALRYPGASVFKNAPAESAPASSFQPNTGVGCQQLSTEAV
jgi:hypothetical protein